MLLLGTVHEAVDHTFSHWRTLSVEDVELAVTLLYQLAEALPVSQTVSLMSLSVLIAVHCSLIYYITSLLQRNR